ncbi:glycosyltransferase family 2 protein [Halioglobus maricola]|uniref:Glycosyltransferase family 2 protein n=1 Tax=Halioglobus maricola TaxID=2601894 RepID=A0A5P9NHK2_9GAMM|nr:glycosyltransferase family A protein [Halioglobus maricola]QFU74684.1 glycosyltransferase family 2 protein [Halioglobus maricola]
MPSEAFKSAKNGPLISVIMPNFNKARYVGESIGSLLAQNYQNWELLIVDDGSTDKSIPIIRDFCNRDPRIKLFQRETLPKGGSACRNIALANSLGSYVIFLDSDDLLGENSLAQRVEYVMQNPGLDFAVFNMVDFLTSVQEQSNTFVVPVGDPLTLLLQHELPWCVMQPIWQKKFLAKLQYFDTSYPRFQDVELHTRALLTPGVKYSVVRDAPPDCFHRTADDRRSINHKEFITLTVQAGSKYIREMERTLLETEERGPGKVKHLNGTKIDLAKRVLHHKISGKIDASTCQSLLLQIAEAGDTIGSGKPIIAATKAIHYFDFTRKPAVFRALKKIFTQ